MKQIRAFVAIDLPPTIQDSIEKQTRRLLNTLGHEFVRWVNVENMHLTLKFLGSVPITHLDFFKQMLTQTADSQQPFEIQIGGIGSFPSLKRPRVLWVGVHAPARLASLQKAVENGANRLGYEKEAKTFSPHLTLGRVRQGLDSKQTQTISNILSMTQLGRIGIARVDSIHLYQSELNPEGSVYTKLFSALLR
ncbi:MAG: RNA 2',3'-cyclic phosphodiesterase [Chloroflexi bacterium]|nr:RNA 2',3'-cyclic phosphodiesterase [Chloroflexota bacterium]